MINQNFSKMRRAMVDSQLRTNNVTDPAIIAAFETVAREDFVPASRQSLAYVDVPLPLGGARSLNAPLVTALLLSEARLSSVDHVLLIGAATGYAAAIGARLAGSIVAVEESSELMAHAQSQLANNDRITLVSAPLNEGCAAAAPYDVIIIEGAIEQTNQTIVDQLREGGRLVSGLSDNGVTRLVSGKKANGAISLIPFADAEVVALPGFDRARSFAF